MRARKFALRMYRKLPPVVWAILVLAFCLALYITVSPSASIANSVPPNKVNLENKPGSASGGELPGGDVELPGAGGELPGGDGKLPDDVGELPGGGEGVAPAIEKPKNIDGDSPDTVLGAGEGEGEKAPSEDAGGEESKGVDEGGEGEHQEEVVHGKSTPDPKHGGGGGGITEDERANTRKEAVRDAMGHAWRGYADKCFGRDEFNPVNNNCKDWMGMGLTLIDSLDTLYIMGYQDEFDRCRDWVEKSLRLDHDRKVSFFETTIRVLGGLLSAYDLSKDQIFLDKAADIGARLGQAFNTASGLPNAEVHLRSGRGNPQTWAGSSLLLAEVGTVQLEFKYLSQHLHNDTWAKKADKVVDVLDAMQKPLGEGMYPYKISTSDPPRFTNQVVTYGAMGDSWFEYLLKLWIQTGKKNDQYKRMYLESTRGLFEHLYVKHEFSGLYYLADMEGSRLGHKMDHLACFASGMLALGYQSGILDDESEETKKQHLDAGAELARTCHQMSQKWASKLAPEYIEFPDGKDIQYARNANYYILRPEASEAMFYMWRVTKDQKFRDMAWDIFQGIENKAKQAHGYASMRNIHNENPTADASGVMQSFLLAETFKYLYLIFCDDSVIPLDDYVFNTEAHPLSVFEKP